MRIDKQLSFTLCRSCFKFKTQECDHNDDERMLFGTWCSLEIDEAVKNGYQIMKIDEVWHWNQREQYDKISKSGISIIRLFIYLFILI